MEWLYVAYQFPGGFGSLTARVQHEPRNSEEMQGLIKMVSDTVGRPATITWFRTLGPVL